MEAPFDPTTNDRKEWDRLNTLKWLPPMKEVRKSIGAGSTNSQPKKISRKIRLGTNNAPGSQTFPHQEIRASDQTKKKLMVFFSISYTSLISVQDSL